MKIDRNVKIRVSGVLVFALGLSFFAANAGQPSDNTAKSEDVSLQAKAVPYAYTKGLASVKTTAGIADELMKVSDLEVSDVDLAYVGQAYESNEGETSEDAKAIPKKDETEEILAQYHNIGIANIKEGNLNVRKEAGTSGKIVGKMTRHNACDILETEGEWYKISSGKVEGYVKAEYIVTGEEAVAIAKEEIITVAKVTGTKTLRVREEATTDSATLALVGEGENLVVSDVKDNWYFVEVDDQEGYVSGDYVEVFKKLPTAQTIEEIRFGSGVSDVRVNLVQYALQFVGNRYVWGGTSLTNGVDCSGFTMQVYKHYGIRLPHHSGSQPAYGTRISASQARPGDLFFYGNGSRIGHVGIYIGNGQIVHASSARTGIKVSNAYYRTPICVVSYLP